MTPSGHHRDELTNGTSLDELSTAALAEGLGGDEVRATHGGAACMTALASSITPIATRLAPAVPSEIFATFFDRRRGCGG